jgi:8-oxo-dGTP pyrophosphatase MutT (NUDIX family)
MTDYVLGFYFGKDREDVYLIEKLKPAWQKGKFNGIGGHIEEGETPHAAMVREMHEETGLVVPHWRHYATMVDGDARIVVFDAVYEEKWLPLLPSNPTAEKVIVANVPSIILNRFTPRYPVIGNLPWLITMALDPNAHNMGVVYGGG